MSNEAMLSNGMGNFILVLNAFNGKIFVKLINIINTYMRIVLG